MRHSAQRWRWRFIISASVGVRFSLNSVFQIFSTITNHLAGIALIYIYNTYVSLCLGACVPMLGSVTPASWLARCGILILAHAFAQHTHGSIVQQVLATIYYRVW